MIANLCGEVRRRGLLALAVLLGMWLMPARPVSAHEASMAAMTLQEIAPGRYLGQWTMPPTDPTLTPIFPSHCEWNAPELNCGQRGLAGRLSFMGLGSKQSVAMIRVVPKEGERQTYTVSVAHPVVTVARDPGADPAVWLDLADTYVNLGIDHILRGIDHLLFVLGLIWLSRGGWSLVHTITAFTIGHSLSLAAATFGLVGVPERPLNAAIALSIVFVGVQIVKLQRGQIGLTARYPWIVAFAFGLLHGLGFASALTTLGISKRRCRSHCSSSMSGWRWDNSLRRVVLALIWAHRRAEASIPRWGHALPAYVIGSVAAFWFLVRI